MAELLEAQLGVTVTLLGFVLAGLAILVALFDRRDVARLAREAGAGGLVGDYFPFWFTSSLATVTAVVDFAGSARLLDILPRDVVFFGSTFLFLWTLFAAFGLVRLVADYGMVRGTLALISEGNTETTAHVPNSESDTVH